MSETKATCVICGHPMPEGEEMFQYHGFSGPCPVVGHVIAERLNAGQSVTGAEARPTGAETEARLRAALMELHAVVMGECPSLFNEDSGGDAELALEIEDLLRSTETPMETTMTSESPCSRFRPCGPNSNVCICGVLEHKHTPPPKEEKAIEGWTYEGWEDASTIEITVGHGYTGMVPVSVQITRREGEPIAEPEEGAE